MEDQYLWNDWNNKEQNGSGREYKKKNDRSSRRGWKSTLTHAVVFGLVSAFVFLATVYGVFQIWGIPSYRYGNIRVVEQAELIEEEQETESAEAENTEEENTQAGSTAQDTAYRSGSVAGVAQAAMPSVVAITSVSIQEIRSFFGIYHDYASQGSGSGIIVGENEDELLIATNYHVIEGASTLNVFFYGTDVSALNTGSGSELAGAVQAAVKGTDEDNDLAVLSVKTKAVPDDIMSQIRIAQLGNSDSLVVGEQVVAIGNALGYGQTVTSGWISALNRNVSMTDGSFANLIQTDAAINPGNSGGALLNMRGEVIGINSAKYASSKVEGTGFAIPISKALPILEKLMVRKTRNQVVDSGQAAYLGVQVADISEEAIWMYDIPQGAFVTQVNEGEAAQEAGIMSNDIIVRMDGEKVTGKEDLITKLRYYEAGETVEIVYARILEGRYQEQSVEVTFGYRPSGT